MLLKRGLITFIKEKNYDLIAIWQPLAVKKMNKQLRRFIFGLLALGVLLLGQGFYTAHLQAQQATRLALGQAGYFMDRLAASASLSLSHDTVQTWIQVKQDWPSLRYLGVLDPQGRAWAAIRPAGSAFGQPFLQRFPVTNQAQQVTLYQGLHSSVLPSWAGLPQVNIVDRPVIVDGTPVVLRAVIDLEPVRLDWQQHMRDVLWFLGSSLLLVSALFWWVHHTPRRLLREVGQFARELSSGHANPLQQEDTGYDEIDDLGRSLQRLQTTLKEQRSSILANERKYKNAIDELDAVVFQIDVDLTWNFLSAGWKRLTGLDPDRFLGQDFSAAFIDSDRPRLLGATQGLINAERNEYRDEVLLRQIDGSPHEMEIAMHAFTDECGNVLGITGTLSDYSRRQNHETEIARQRLLFQQIIDHLPVSIYVKNEQSDYVLVNEQGARVLGHTPDKIVGKTDRDFLLPDHAAARYAEDREVLRNGVTIAREQMISLNGEVRYWLGRKVRLNAGNGNMLVLQAVIDITDRKKAEIELQRQREFIERVIETDPTLIFVKDEDCRYVMVNSAYAKTFGLSREQFIGKKFEELHHQPEEIAAETWSDQRVLELGAETVADVTLTRSKDQRRHFMAIKKPLRMPDGRIHVLGIKQDISELKYNEQALMEQTRKVENASRAKSEFMANMSHEIRTPMNGILGMTELVLNSPLNEEQRQYLSLARASANSLLAIINEILDFSKIEAGRMTIEQTGFDFYELMSEISKPLALQAHTRGLSFFAKIDPEIPSRLVGDPTRLRQVLTNLLSNAVKFTAEGQVTLEINCLGCEYEDLHLEFIVSDTGIGVAADKQSLIFEPFAQADGTTTRKYGGTGLGLTISSRLVELMGGKIRVDSQQGVGSHFSFELHLARDPNVEPGSGLGYESLAGMSVAWLDSSEQRAQWYRELLARWHADANSTTNVADAAVLVSQTALDVLLIDDEIAPEDARTLLSVCRARNPGCALVILSRAYDNSLIHRRETSLIDLLNQSGETYLRLIKPVIAVELHQALLRLAKKETLLVPHSIAGNINTRSSMRILLAEDNYVNQVLAVSVLEKMQHIVDIASNGHEALSKLEDNHYDLVLMDVQMPQIGGLEATRLWREREQELGLKRLPIIAMTAHAMRGDRERCIQAGMDGYVSKPFQQATLQQEIEQVLGSARQELMQDELEPSPVVETQFNRERALVMLQNDALLLQRVAKVFLQAAPGVCARLQQAAERQQADLLHRAVHEVKGMAYNLGAELLAQIAADMEKLARENRFAEAMLYYDRLLEQFDAVTRVMQEVATDPSVPSAS